MDDNIFQNRFCDAMTFEESTDSNLLFRPIHSLYTHNSAKLVKTFLTEICLVILEVRELGGFKKNHLDKDSCL